MSGFDPYHTWLGIPKADQPPNHYRLLGIQAFESDPQVIDNAADRLMIHLRTFAAGPNGPLSQKLLNEVAAARSTLQQPEVKAAYDAQLRAKLQANRPLPQARQVVAQPIYVPVHMPVPMPPMPVEAPPAPPGHGFESPASAPVSFSVASSSSSRRGRRKPEGGAGTAVLGIIKMAVGGLGGISIAVLGVWIFARSDPFGLFTEKKGGDTVVAVAPTTVSPTTTPPAGTPAVTPVEPKEVTTSESTGTTKSAKAKSTATSLPKSVTPKTASPTETSDDSSSDPSSPDASSSSNAGTTTVEPIEVPEPSQTPPTPAPQPAAIVVALPEMPSNEAQQAKLTELKQRYKSEFDQGLKPAGREPFIDFLLATADKLKSDPVARFVLLREAYSRLVGLKEFPSAAEVVDRLDAEFAMDPFKLRLHLLTEASAAAKQPAERLGIARCASELVELALQRQRIGEAEKLVRIAEGQAKALSDNDLRAKMTAQKLNVEKLSVRWAPVERARQRLLAEPNNAQAAALDGRYRCLVEGDWNVGLALLAKSGDAVLAQPAQQDQAASADNAAAATLGDQWFDIAASDKDLEGFYARARHWYEQAVAAAPADEKVRLTQRIEQIDALDLPPRLLGNAPAADPIPPLFVAFSQMQIFEQVDLTKFIAAPELRNSGWNGNGGSLYSRSNAAAARIPAHYSPPREYQVIINVGRQRFFSSDDGPPKPGPFFVGLVGPKTQFLAAIDLPAGGEFSAALSLASAKDAEATTVVKSPFAAIPDDGRDVTVNCEVRRRSVTIRVNGTAVCRYEGDLEKLVLPKEWSVGDIRAPFIGSQNSSFQVTSWQLAPLDPEPRLGPADATPALSTPAFGAPAAAGPSTDGFFNRP